MRAGIATTGAAKSTETGEQLLQELRVGPAGHAIGPGVSLATRRRGSGRLRVVHELVQLLASLFVFLVRDLLRVARVALRRGNRTRRGGRAMGYEVARGPGNEPESRRNGPSTQRLA